MSSTSISPRAVAFFAANPPRLRIRAPGRVNLIGEHTDYNDGFVMPVATEQALHVLAAPRRDNRLRVHSAAMNQTVEASLEQIAAARTATAGTADAAAPRPFQQWPAWAAYVLGVVATLPEEGVAFGGADLFIDGDLPLGAGLSSSAAVDCGVALALTTLAGTDIDRVRLAQLCRLSDHRYVGTPCGIMDQFACLNCRAGCALILDCRDLSFEHVLFPTADVAILIADTRVRHAHAEGAYARRVAECRDATRILAQRRPAIRSLRDATHDDLSAAAPDMPDAVRRRARHVIDENRRLHRFADDLRAGRLDALGETLAAGHASLRDLYEVSCRELDDLVDVLCRAPGVLGARMTGGGFGGCVVALVHPAAVAEVQDGLKSDYDPKHERPARTWVTHPAAGAEVFPLGT